MQLDRQEDESASQSILNKLLAVRSRCAMVQVKAGKEQGNHNAGVQRTKIQL